MQVFEEGLKYDPFHPEMKEGQEDAIQQHVQDLLEGEALQHTSKLETPLTAE